MNRFTRIRHVEETDSTNEDISRILGDEDARGLTLVADFQRRGTGRRGRAWVAPPGSALLFTTALPDALPAGDLWAVPFWIALAVRAALEAFGISGRLVWPNDLLIGGRKAAGMLCVSRISGPYAWVGCGVGINVTRPGDESLVRGIDPPPAFVSDVREIKREHLLHEILQQADASYDTLSSPLHVAHDWEEAAGIPGTRYRLLMDGETEPFDAQALRLLEGGALLVVRDGERIEVSLADARVIRD